MQIAKKMKAKQEGNYGEQGVTIAFLGDSVTQGCFGMYTNYKNELLGICDQNSVYHRDVAKILGMLYPSVPVNIINAGIGGQNATEGYERLERDVLSHNPDLVVVCFGLNDAGQGREGIDKYRTALENIFARLKEENVETIFLTPNMICTAVSDQIKEEAAAKLTADFVRVQTEGLMDAYMDAAQEVCRKYDITICDCYRKWKLLYENGVDINALLANHINHPTKEMHWLFAISLVETMMEK